MPSSVTSSKAPSIAASARTADGSTIERKRTRPVGLGVSTETGGVQAHAHTTQKNAKFDQRQCINRTVVEVTAARKFDARMLWQN
jgi:hypothetical protein